PSSALPGPTRSTRAVPATNGTRYRNDMTLRAVSGSGRFHAGVKGYRASCLPVDERSTIGYEPPLPATTAGAPWNVYSGKRSPTTVLPVRARRPWTRIAAGSGGFWSTWTRLRYVHWSIQVVSNAPSDSMRLTNPSRFWRWGMPPFVSDSPAAIG